MKTSAAARSSGDASPSFSSRIPERSGFGGFLTSGGRRVQVLRSSSQRKPMAFIFSACSGVTSRADEEAWRGVRGIGDRVWVETTNAAAVPQTTADSTDSRRRISTSSLQLPSSNARRKQCSTFMQLGSTRQSVPFERLQPRHWLETFQEWISQPQLVARTRAAGFLALGFSHPSILQAASSSKAAVSALAPNPLVNAPSHSESLWLITDLSRTNTPTLFTTPRKNVMSYTSGASARPARLVAEYWLHAGFYLSPPPPPAKCDRRKGGGRKKKAGKKKK